MSGLLWVCLGLIFYHYFLYPILVWSWARFWPRPYPKGPTVTAPSVSMIVAAYNEERVIENKIRNMLSLHYNGPWEIIIVSDGSSDRTPEICSRFADQVTCLHAPERRGKSSALNRAVARAKHEVLVFSDANSFFRPDALQWLLSPLGDPQVGGVCGRKSIVRDDRAASQGDATYWDFESRLKTWQSLGGSITTADGEIFAIRRENYVVLPESLINDDQELTLAIAGRGQRIVYAPRAVTEELASLKLREDFRVKARMVYGGLQALARRPWLLVPFAGPFSFHFFSHKVLRYCMPFLLMGTLVGVFWVEGALIRALRDMQAVFYACALMGLCWHLWRPRGNPFYLPFYYCCVNLAALWGWIHFFRARSLVATWAKAER